MTWRVTLWRVELGFYTGFELGASGHLQPALLHSMDQKAKDCHRLSNISNRGNSRQFSIFSFFFSFFVPRFDGGPSHGDPPITTRPAASSLRVAVSGDKENNDLVCSMVSLESHFIPDPETSPYGSCLLG